MRILGYILSFVYLWIMDYLLLFFCRMWSLEGKCGLGVRAKLLITYLFICSYVTLKYISIQLLVVIKICHFNIRYCMWWQREIGNVEEEIIAIIAIIWYEYIYLINYINYINSTIPRISSTSRVDYLIIFYCWYNIYQS